MENENKSKELTDEELEKDLAKVSGGIDNDELSGFLDALKKIGKGIQNIIKPVVK